jgi:chromate transporter
MNVGTAPNTPTNAAFRHPSFREALMVWLRIGVLSFGGPTAQIALMHKEIVDERRWLTEQQFLNALGFCMLLPGPEAMQLATYSGWRLHGWLGGLAAGLSFVMPGAVVILALGIFYTAVADLALAQALFIGIQAAIVVVVIEALIRISKRTLTSAIHWTISASAFVAIFALDLPFPLIIAAAALVGALLIRPGDASDPEPDSETRQPQGARLPGARSQAARPHAAGRTAGTIAVWLLIWWVPLLALTFVDADGRLFEIGLFFSNLAVVTFGGAYAVLAYMAQDVVEAFGWLTAEEMMVALGLAETTPGPLILVTEFVGFLAAQKAGGLWMGVAGAGVALWATFVPCFLWIFAGAPYIDQLARKQSLRGALSGITAAVVGVILNLSLWFAMHVFFGTVEPQALGPLTPSVPDFATLNPALPALTAICALMAFRFHWGIGRILVLSAGLGLAGGSLSLW